MEEFELDVKACVKTLAEGGTILYPTDTIWGLGCDATNAEAIEEISKIKNRPTNKSYIVLMSDVQMLRQHLSNPIPDLESFVLENSSQSSGKDQATTIIYDGVIGIADNALAEDGSLGIRIPQDDFCIALLKRYRKPIISTSANLSGEVNPSFYNHIDEVVKNRVSYQCLWRQEDEQPKEPSRIIKLNNDGSIIKIR